MSSLLRVGCKLSKREEPDEECDRAKTGYHNVIDESDGEIVETKLLKKKKTSSF